MCVYTYIHTYIYIHKYIQNTYIHTTIQTNVNELNDIAQHLSTGVLNLYPHLMWMMLQKAMEHYKLLDNTKYNII